MEVSLPAVTVEVPAWALWAALAVAYLACGGIAAWLVARAYDGKDDEGAVAAVFWLWPVPFAFLLVVGVFMLPSLLFSRRK